MASPQSPTGLTPGSVSATGGATAPAPGTQTPRGTPPLGRMLADATQPPIIGIWSADLTTDVVSWSPEILQIIGLPPTFTPRPDSLLAFTHEDDRARVAAWIQAAAKGGRPSPLLAFRIVRPGSPAEVRYVEGRGLVQFDASGRAVHVSGTLEDVTAREDLTGAIRVAVKRLQLALDAARLGTYDWDMRSGAINWNRRHAELWGMQPEEFAGTFEAFAERVHPDDVARVNEAVQQCIESRVPYRAEFRVVWPDGSIHWVTGRGEVFHDQAGRPERMLGVVFDTTEAHVAREQLEHYSQSLRALARRVDEVREEERKRIAIQLHDEFGQALTGIKMDLVAIERLVTAAVPQEERPAVLVRTSHMRQAIDGAVADVRRLSSELRPRLLDDLGLGAAVEWQLRTFQQRSGIPVALTLRLSDAPIPQACATVAYRVLLEALTNIVRHAQAHRVTVRIVSTQTELRMEVRDDGVGLDEERARSLTSLGLFGMRERAAAVGGRVTIEPARPRGTKVRLNLPLREA